ncbi:MAG TPA: SCO family protein [Verrucomicrobiae bacterium]|nr:SCO family protein [Verrucomicrobiae bacterium]
MAGIETNASSLSEEALLQIKFDQKLGNQVSLDLPFRDEDGKSVQIGDYFNHKPVILNLGYYECPMLCSLVLNGAVEALQDLKASPGEDFEFVCVSIHPAETPGQAAAKKRTFVKRYGRDDTGDGWRFLTGDEAAIERLADEVGFRYAYDAQLREYAHPSGLIVLTPEGKVSRYLFGVSFSASEIDRALKDARGKRIGSPIEQLILLCFHYRPLTGKYGELIMTVVRASGVVTLAGIGWIVVAVRRRQRGRFAREVDQ